MKFRSAIALLLIPMLLLSACGGRQVSITESDQHFAALCQELYSAARQHDISLVDETYSYAENFDDTSLYYMANRDLYYDFDDGLLSVYLQNDGFLYEEVNERTIGRETFSVYYTLYSADFDYDLALFCDLVNTISVIQLTESECKEFLEAPPEDYPVWMDDDTGYDVEKEKDYPTPYSSFSLIPDCRLYYTEQNGERELFFSGLCKEAARSGDNASDTSSPTSSDPADDDLGDQTKIISVNTAYVS